MAVCKDCGIRIGYMNSIGDKCSKCYYIVEDEKKIDEANQSISITAEPAATTYTSIAWFIVGLGFICTIIAALLFALDDQIFLAVIVFISGCFGAVFLGLLAEISSNLAKLVNKSR